MYRAPADRLGPHVIGTEMPKLDARIVPHVVLEQFPKTQQKVYSIDFFFLKKPTTGHDHGIKTNICWLSSPKAQSSTTYVPEDCAGTSWHVAQLKASPTDLCLGHPAIWWVGQ